MKAIGEAIQRHLTDILAEWERLVREEPWYSLPSEHRLDNLRDVVIEMAEAALCARQERAAHRRLAETAAEHGAHRRTQEIPEHLILTELHLLRHALWHYLTRTFGSSDRTTRAILRLDRALALATNASMWGYYREEIDALGKWDAGMEQIVSRSSLLHDPPDV